MEDFDYTPKFSGGDSPYFKIEDGETIKFRIVSPTHIRLQARQNDELVDTKDWSDDDWQEAINSGDFDITERFVWVVLVREDDKDPVAKVLEQGAGVFKKISSIAKDPDWSPITETDLKITRNGSGIKTRYEVVPAPSNRGPISDDEFAIADEIQITKLVPGAMPVTKFQEKFGN